MIGSNFFSNDGNISRFFLKNRYEFSLSTPSDSERLGIFRKTVLFCLRSESRSIVRHRSSSPKESGDDAIVNPSIDPAERAVVTFGVSLP